jgi:hypothetical protein
MKKIACINKLLVFLVCVLVCLGLQALSQNRALHFDGDNDYVTLDPILDFQPNADFTVEMWIKLDMNTVYQNEFRRLFTFVNDPQSDGSLFEFGVHDGDFRLQYSSEISGTNSGGIIYIDVGNTLFDFNWHHIAVVREGDLCKVYLDCAERWDNTGYSDIGVLNTRTFEMGTKNGTYEPFSDWFGEIEEFKLWNVARPHAQLIENCSACMPPFNASCMVAYWPFDQGVAGGNNTSIQTVTDISPSANHGMLSPFGMTPPGFALNGLSSNFILSTAPLVYPAYNYHKVVLSNPNQTTTVSSICNGEAVHFSVTDNNGQAVQPALGTIVNWQYSDDNGLNWYDIVPVSPVFEVFTFVSPPGHPALSISCSNHPTGFVDRHYRAVIYITEGTNTCYYEAESEVLTICCPVQSAYVEVTPAEFSQGFCEGENIDLNVKLVSNMPNPSGNNYVNITWYLIVNSSSTHLPAYDNMLDFTYNLTNMQPHSICFRAVISNCSCPVVTVQACTSVEPMPVCGTITGSSANLIQIGTNEYHICPGDDAAIAIDQPFFNCNAVWQYRFPNTQPNTWNNLGSGNPIQNTNILPQLTLGSQQTWPTGETCIQYRIACLPMGYPNSNCSPCYSNMVSVCLKPEPQMPLISGQNPICTGSATVLYVQNPEGGVTYQWYYNGLQVGVGNSIPASQEGCYKVVADDGCYTLVSDEYCLTVCKPIAIISCPDCPCVGDVVTLSAAQSFFNCGLAVSYNWSFSSGTLIADNGVTIDHKPDPSGTTYTLTIIDEFGCSHTTSLTIVPCND